MAMLKYALAGVALAVASPTASAQSNLTWLKCTTVYDLDKNEPIESGNYLIYAIDLAKPSWRYFNESDATLDAEDRCHEHVCVFNDASLTVFILGKRSGQRLTSVVINRKSGLMTSNIVDYGDEIVYPSVRRECEKAENPLSAPSKF